MWLFVHTVQSVKVDLRFNVHGVLNMCQVVLTYWRWGDSLAGPCTVSAPWTEFKKKKEGPSSITKFWRARLVAMASVSFGFLWGVTVAPSTWYWVWYWWSNSLAEIEKVHPCFCVSTGNRTHRILSPETIPRMKPNKWSKVVVSSPSCPLFSDLSTTRNWSLIRKPSCEPIPIPGGRLANVWKDQ